MAMLCSKYNRECEGCGECMELDPPMYCPHCDRPLVYVDKVFKLDGDVIGCEYCITEADAEDELLEELTMKKNLNLTFGGKFEIQDYGIFLDDARLEDVLREYMGTGSEMLRLALTIEPLADAGLHVETNEAEPEA